MNTKKITRTAVILAITLAFQSLRLIPFIGNLPNQSLIIGTLVNLTLVIGSIIVGPFAAVIISTITPVIAFIQGFMPNPLLIFPVATGNLALSLIVSYFYKKNKYIAVALGAISKWIIISNTAVYVLKTFIKPAPEKLKVLSQAFGTLQFYTAIIGGVIAILISETIIKAMTKNKS